MPAQPWRFLTRGATRHNQPRGGFSTPIDIEVSQASKSAIEAIESAGGKIVCAYYNRLGLRALLKPEKFLQNGKPIPKRARPIPKAQEYYTKYENRGYLSPEIQLAALRSRQAAE